MFDVAVGVITPSHEFLGEMVFCFKLKG